MREEPGVLQTSRRADDTENAKRDPRECGWGRRSCGGQCLGKKMTSAPPRLLPGFQDFPRCHRATVIFNLLRLLTRDLRLAAQTRQCV
jgi:hypothetical protein